jgi:hypothetical protein
MTRRVGDSTRTSGQCFFRRKPLAAPGPEKRLARPPEPNTVGQQVAGAIIPGLRAHLAGCPACREEHESLRELVGGHA